MKTPTLQDLTKILTSRESLGKSPKSLFFRRAGASAILAGVDLTILAFAMFSSLFIRNLVIEGQIQISYYYSLIPLLLPLFPLAFYLRGLYPAFGMDVVEELRNLTYSITVVFAVLATLTFFVNGAWEYSRLAFLLSWAIAIPMVPIGRAVARKAFGQKSWWGVPVVIIGAGKAGEKVIKSFQKNQHLGLRPLLGVDDDVDRWGYINRVPVIGGLDVIPKLIEKIPVDHAIIAMPGVERKLQQKIIEKYSKYFAHTTVVPGVFGLSSLWVKPRDFGGIFGLEVSQSLLRYGARFQKRVFDIVLASILTIIAAPILGAISAAIYLDAKGKIFFKQLRMGINDSKFEVIKFRTMRVDAEKRLTDLLDSDPELKEEYEIYHKLRNDPRVTRVGKVLRKYSLDELPQFWNVLKGEMSLIGPRAYMPWEKEKMNGAEEIILKVKPGISGLWQVTDRNQSSFEERTLTDVYYIRNWSMFLDFYILAKTIAVVLSGRSGY